MGMEYRITHPSCRGEEGDDTLLAEIRYGTQHVRDRTDPRRIVIGTPPIASASSCEVWHLPEVTTAGWSGDIGYVFGRDFLFAHLLVHESVEADLAYLTHQAYARLIAFVRSSRCPHLLRIWNYLSRINEYDRGVERYQSFSNGRAMAFAEAAIPEHCCPAATAIGCDAPGLSIHLLAGRQAGTPIENPRQISAYRYPLTYGPRSPSFARAMLYAGPEQSRELAISGTASIVGHVTMHPGHLMRQLRETIRNIESVIDNPRIFWPLPDPAHPGWLKVYLRDPGGIHDVDAVLRAWAGEKTNIFYLRGAICRRALEIEIEGHYRVSRQDNGDLSRTEQAEYEEGQQMDHPADKQALPPHPVLSDHYSTAEDRVGYIRRLFDRTASNYDRINAWMSLNRGERYRQEAMLRVGVQQGQSVLDCACGTGVMAAHAQALVGVDGEVIAMDPSLAMLAIAKERGVRYRVAGIAEQLALPDQSVDVITMGYALRHVADLGVAFAEFVRVLRPGGRLLILEMVPPASGVGYLLTKLYLKYLVPTIASWVARGTDARQLMRYYWDTVDQCVAPEIVIEALREAGFSAVSRSVRFALLTEYTASRPDD